MLNLVCGFFTPDALASLENRLATEVGDAETALQTIQRRSMAFTAEDNCSLCNSTSVPASLTPGVHLASSGAPSWETRFVTSTTAGNVGLHQNRPEDLSRLPLNRPPSARPLPSWLGYPATPRIRSGGTLPLLNRAEGVRSHPTRPSSFGSSHPHQPSSVARTSGIPVLSTALYTPTPSTVANHTDPISGPVGPSLTPGFSMPLPLPASPTPDSPSQELPRSPSHTTNLPVGQQTLENSPTSPPADENNINGTDP